MNADNKDAYAYRDCCPVCGSTDVEEDCWTGCDGDDYMERWCNSCKFRTGGDYYNMDEYWKLGVSNIDG